jgi:DNA-binding NarL/FixJ family response regulator
MLDRIPDGGPDPRTILSSRELEVLDLACRGFTNAQVAVRLCVTVHAVKFHLASIYRKLGVTNRTEAAVVYLAAAQGNGVAGTGVE